MAAVTYELWDGELGLRLGTFESRAEALAAVLRLTQGSAGSPAPLGLTAGGVAVIASGEELLRLAEMAAATS